MRIEARAAKSTGVTPAIFNAVEEGNGASIMCASAGSTSARPVRIAVALPSLAQLFNAGLPT